MLPDEQTPHVDLGGYVLDRLDGEERSRLEEHLGSCADCRQSLGELTGVTGLLERIGPAFEAPPGLEARTFAAIERAAAEVESPAVPERREAWRHRLTISRPRLAIAAVVAIAALAFVGVQLERQGPAGTLELRAALGAPAGGPPLATAEVTKTGIGRVIAFETDELPILPKGEYYELWFVGPGDTLERPNRISAGTFHPDENGRSDVRFAAAVDPAKYPVLSVTAEPGDGDPQRTGPEVLRTLP